MNYLQLDNLKCTVLKYSPLQKTYTLKGGLGSFKIIRNDAIW